MGGPKGQKEQTKQDLDTLLPKCLATKYWSHTSVAFITHEEWLPTGLKNIILL